MIGKPGLKIVGAIDTDPAKAGKDLGVVAARGLGQGAGMTVQEFERQVQQA
jgi:hypothetical protein